MLIINIGGYEMKHKDYKKTKDCLSKGKDGKCMPSVYEKIKPTQTDVGLSLPINKKKYKEDD